MANCEQVLEQLSLYIDGMLEEEQEAKLQIHLKDCAECRERLALYRAISALGPELEIEPPPNLHESIMNRIDAAGKRKKFFLLFSPRTMGMVAAAAVVVALVSSGTMDNIIRNLSPQSASKVAASTAAGSANQSAADTALMGKQAADMTNGAVEESTEDALSSQSAADAKASETQEKTAPPKVKAAAPSDVSDSEEKPAALSVPETKQEEPADTGSGQASVLGGQNQAIPPETAGSLPDTSDIPETGTNESTDTTSQKGITCDSKTPSASEPSRGVTFVRPDTSGDGFAAKNQAEIPYTEKLAFCLIAEGNGEVPETIWETAIACGTGESGTVYYVIRNNVGIEDTLKAALTEAGFTVKKDNEVPYDETLDAGLLAIIKTP